MLADELICELLADRLKDDDCRRGYVLDGVPRTLAQAHCLDASGDGVDVAVALLVSDGETATRIAERLFDPVSFSTYHPRHVPAPASVVHRLIRRTDDTSETHVRRLQEFRQHFDDICTYYENRGILRRVSGDGLPEEIAGEIVSIITDLR
jgi:adenylate kinase